MLIEGLGESVPGGRIQNWKVTNMVQRALQAATQVAATRYIIGVGMSEHLHMAMVPVLETIKEETGLEHSVYTFMFRRKDGPVGVLVIMKPQHFHDVNQRGTIESITMQQHNGLMHTFARGEFEQLGIMVDED